MVHVGADGTGLMYVSIDSLVEADPLVDVGDFRALVDPSFRIDADFLAAHPDASLEVLGGVANASARSLAEPGSATGLAGGLLLLGLFTGRGLRQRRALRR